MITDDQMIKAAKTVRQYCKEHTACSKCVCRYECDRWFEGNPDMWAIPEDDKGSQVDNEAVEIIADIGELNEDDE